MRNTIFFLIALAVSSFGLQHLSAMAEEKKTEIVSVEKKEVILGHRIGPNGSVMLVTK